MTDENKKQELANTINEFLDSLSVAIPLYKEYERRLEEAYSRGQETIEVLVDRNILGVDNKALDFIKEYTFELLKKSNDDMINKLKDVISRGALNSIGKSQMLSEIQDIMKTSHNRAEMILETETARAYNFGRISAAKVDSKLSKKYWIAILDKRTSALCTRLSIKYSMNKAIPLDQPFVDDITGQKFMAPAAHPWCRSVLGFV